MSALIGAKRMQFAGRRIALIALSCGLLMWTAMCVIWMIAPGGPSWFASTTFFFGGLLLSVGVQGAILWLAGWIVEGFAKQ